MSDLRQHIDDFLGHVVIHYDGSTQPVALLVDCGDRVRVDDPLREAWTTDEAREIGRALIGWASRKERGE